MRSVLESQPDQRRGVCIVSDNPPWPPVSALPSPASGGVSLWLARLDGDPAQVAACQERLTAEEARRAAGFRMPAAQRRFIVSRAILRHLLGTCLDERPETLRFFPDAHGKPRLVHGGGWEFNLAHSADVLLLAVRRDGAVGVDVEQVRPLKNAAAIAQRFFTAREAAWLGTRSAEDRDRAFFRLWTRKEAVLKATGEGIQGGLGGVELLDDRHAFNPIVRRRGGPAAGSCWRLIELCPADGYVGALAVPETSEKGG